MKKTLGLFGLVALSLVLMLSCSEKPEENSSAYSAGVYKSDTTVLFVYSPEKTVESVAITGDFNNWSEEGIALELEDGVWKVVLKLDYGIYQYKYIVDGEMISDPAGEASMPDGKGGKNSIIEVTVD